MQLVEQHIVHDSSLIAWCERAKNLYNQSLYYCRQVKYVGKRKKRGLFVTATGKLINADVNGSLNIARLVLGDEIINSDSIRSCVVQPKMINIISNKITSLKSFSK